MEFAGRYSSIMPLRIGDSSSSAVVIVFRPDAKPVKLNTILKLLSKAEKFTVELVVANFYT